MLLTYPTRQSRQQGGRLSKRQFERFFQIGVRTVAKKTTTKKAPKRTSSAKVAKKVAKKATKKPAKKSDQEDGQEDGQTIGQKTATQPAGKKAATKKTTVKKKSTTKKKAVKAEATEETSLGELEVQVDRRREKDRRNVPGETSHQGRPAAERRKVARRRQIDPTTCERDYSGEEIEFMHALDEYKRRAGRMFPTCSEILEVVRELGYRRLTPDEQATLASQGPDPEAMTDNLDDNAADSRTAAADPATLTTGPDGAHATPVVGRGEFPDDRFPPLFSESPESLSSNTSNFGLTVPSLQDFEA